MAIYFCGYCSKITKWNQEVKCIAKEFSVISQFQIPRPYFCSRTDCSLHLGTSAMFCPKQRNFNKALIHEYDLHFYNDQPPKQCIYCGDTKEQSVAYCHERANSDNLHEYLNKFPLLSNSRIKNSTNTIWEMGTLFKNVSYFFLYLRIIYIYLKTYLKFYSYVGRKTSNLRTKNYTISH